jgi:hypothetical protein
MQTGDKGAKAGSAYKKALPRRTQRGRAKVINIAKANGQRRVRG